VKLNDITLLDAINDPALFASGSWFKKRTSWENWFTFLNVFFALGGLSRSTMRANIGTPLSRPRT
jgi:hypothetical protein